MFKRLLIIVCALLSAALIFSCAHRGPGRGSSATGFDPPRKSRPRAEAFSHFLAATMLERRGAMDEAITEMRAAADLQPDSSSLTLRLIRAYVRNQDYDNARDMAERAVTQIPDNANLWVVLGEIYHQLNNYDKAVEAFQKAIEIDPENVLGYGALVSIEEKTNDLVAALDIYQRLARMTPNSAGVHFQLGLCLVRINDNENALPSLERALELNPNLIRAHYLIGAIHLENGDNEKAVDHLEQYLDQSNLPDAEQAREQLAAVFARMGRYDDSLEQLDLLIESKATLSRHHLERMYVLLRAGKAPQALEVVPPDDMPILGAFFRALARKKIGEPYQAAVQALDTVDGNVDEETRSFLNELLYLYSDNDAGKFLVSELTALRGEGIRSNAVDLLLARTLINLERYEEAIPVLEGVLEHDGPQHAAHFDLATCYELLEKPVEAETHLKACLEIEPNDPEIMNFLGYMYAVNKMKLDEAEKLLVRALEIDPDNGYYLDSLGWIYYQMGNPDKALDFLKKAVLASESDDAELRDHLGDIYLLKGDTERALAEWRRANRLNPKLEGVKEKIDQHAK
ncbi:MAG TPA: tetratricopeptide repeat protein [Candidatus Bathyarchaeia archaeon]|nr:tetratricopeptide repeat protein [Candidatus Bathyarchaeia archaeon]